MVDQLRPYKAASLPKVSLFLPVVILLLAPIDTIDLAGGAASFGLTPILLVSIIAFALSIPRTLFATSSRQNLWRNIRDQWPVLGLLLIIPLSTFLADQDPAGLSPKRAILTLWFISFTIWFMARLGVHFPRALFKATHIYIVLNSGVVLLQLAIFYLNVELPGSLVPFLNWQPGRVAGFPRLNGMVDDPNRAAVILVIMMGLCYLITRTSGRYFYLPLWVYFLGVTQIILTVSRTGYVAGILLLFGLWITQQRLRLNTTLGATLLLLVGILVVLQVSDQIIPSLDAALVGSIERQGSTETHFGLLAAGLFLFLSEIKRFLIGVGWGTSYVHTDSFFPNNVYGNFHSGFITFAVTTGIFGLFFYLSYLLSPLLRRLTWAPLAICLIWSNLFYEFHNELIFWVALFSINSVVLQKSISLHIEKGKRL